METMVDRVIEPLPAMLDEQPQHVPLDELVAERLSDGYTVVSMSTVVVEETHYDQSPALTRSLVHTLVFSRNA